MVQMRMASLPLSESLRILCLDGGGIKGYTSLLILKRIFRTIAAEGQLADIPRPCDVFDLIVGTSTGGLIAVMLGRLHMTIDDCIVMYEQVGKEVFGNKPHGGQLRMVLKGIRSSPFYDITRLQEEVKKVLVLKEIPTDAAFLEPNIPLCKVMLCVTRTEISKPDVLRNYKSLHPTAENYDCRIWEAASATAAAPMYFKRVQFDGAGEKWCDGGLRRNNPINEALSEVSREQDWENKQLGCVLSLGTGIAKSGPVSSNLAGVLKGAVAIMTDSDDIARVFASSSLGIELTRTHRYFRFNIPQGMQDLQLDEWKETEKMRALTTDYLSHMGTGELVQQCAKSLLYPDENLQIEIKPKRSIIPYNPCTHFVERRLYAETLLKFFRVHKVAGRIFVLWGLGGIGKTQIALKFAQSMRHRFSVFWIRADRFTNFAADYMQVLKELDPNSSNDNHANIDLSIMLDKTRRRLEEISGEWLLILDNADDLDAFLGRGPKQDNDDEFAISKFIPRQGRILITTRDRRFQGTVAATSDGMKVDSMSKEEAKGLLIGSIPGYLIRDGSDSMRDAKELIEELGYLPLAIAQAAANILEQQLTLAEYVSFYKDKRQRMNLMQAPAYDFQSTDPRNCSQSVRVTWQISFDILKEKFPMSATFLSYIGCFHWRHINRELLRRLPEFRDLDERTFIQLSKKTLNLSLVEENEDSEPGFIEYSVHPLVHENILGRMPPEEIRRYLEPVIALLSITFPIMYERNTKEWSLAVYLAPHAVRQVELCEEIDLSSEPLIRLLLHMSYFFSESNLFNIAADLAEKSLLMGYSILEPNAFELLDLRRNVISRLYDASRFEEAERQARGAIDSLDSIILGAEKNGESTRMKRISLLSLLSMTLLANNSHREREEIHREQLASGLVDERTEVGTNIKHNLAHALLQQGKLEDARVINNDLLEFSETEEGKSVVPPRLYLILLNLKASIIRRSGFRGAAHNGFVRMDPLQPAEQEARLHIHELVFTESVKQLGIEDIDSWKAINNLTGFLAEAAQYGKMGQILQQVLPAGIAAKITVEGKFETPINEITSKANIYLDFLVSSQGQNESVTEDFRKLLSEWISCSGSSDMPYLDRLYGVLNNQAVNLQYKGRFEEAEVAHQRVIDLWLLQEKGQVPDVYYYNLMLSIGRQGRIEDARALRNTHRAELEPAEAALGTLEERLEEDEGIHNLYLQAQTMLDDGDGSRDGDWWQVNARALLKAEQRYGILKANLLSGTAPHDEEKEAGLMKKTGVKIPFRSKRARKL